MSPRIRVCGRATCGRACPPPPRSLRYHRKDYCSRACLLAAARDERKQRTARSTDLTCEKCGVSVRRVVRHLGAHPVRCRRCAIELRLREGTARAVPGWATLAERVRKRDGYRCRRCNKSEAENGRKLSVDHIIPRRVAPELAHVEANLAALCARCHGIKTHTLETRFIKKGDVLGLQEYVRQLDRAPLARRKKEDGSA